MSAYIIYNCVVSENIHAPHRKNFFFLDSATPLEIPFYFILNSNPSNVSLLRQYQPPWIQPADTFTLLEIQKMLQYLNTNFLQAWDEIQD